MTDSIITLYQFPRFRKLSSGSSFCVKLETYLKARGLDYKNKVLTDPRKSPVGKLPYISRGSETVTDSDRIICLLESEAGEAGLDIGLTDDDHARAHVVRRMVEEHLYWGLVYSVWLDPILAPPIVEERFSALNPIARRIAKPIIMKQIAGDLRSQGLGRHSRDDLYRLVSDDIRVLSQLLADSNYFLGDKFTTVDCAIFGVLEVILHSENFSPLYEVTSQQDNLVAYHQRIKQAVWA